MYNKSVINHPQKVYRLRKALYGLKQAPRAWYDELSNFLMSKGFTKGTIDPTLFMITYAEDILLVQIYVDDIIFGTLDLPIPKSASSVLLCMLSSKTNGKAPQRDVDHAGCLDTHKITSRGIQFLGEKVVSWMSKKHDCPVMSTAEAETEYQLAEMFTKALSQDRFKYLVGRLGMRCLILAELEVLANEIA
ncbi:retrotransposon protein, putative, unclassified [Tanacetum coccineum]|uniref:Retrotransposon protein, putative, unclassified n=1 Tax=Tanacetum coccineum TaxID=301880 RepID=A0ABQ5AQ34_9ASTR